MTECLCSIGRFGRKRISIFSLDIHGQRYSKKGGSLYQSMVRVQRSRSIDASQVKIFSVVKDINRLPEMFPKHYSINVLEQSENHLYTEENVVTTGKEIH